MGWYRVERGAKPVKETLRGGLHTQASRACSGRGKKGAPQAWLWQWVGRTHLNPVRTPDFRRSKRFPPKPAVPHTVATQACDEKAFFMSQLETYDAHPTGVKDRRAGTREGTDMQSQRHPIWVEHPPDLVFSWLWTHLGTLGPQHGASPWKTEWGLGSRRARFAGCAVAPPSP